MLTRNPRITAAGLALFKNQAPGFSVAVTHIALGAAVFEPTGTETALKSEFARFPVESGVDISPSQIQVGALVKNSDPQGRSPNSKHIGEIGFYVGSTLLAILSQPERALFYKSPDLDVPISYILDFSTLPPGSLTVGAPGLSGNLQLAAQTAQAEGASARNAAVMANTTLNVIRSAYYGSYAAAPSARPDGTPRQKGDRYFDAQNNVEKTFNGANWYIPNIDAAAVEAALGELRGEPFIILASGQSNVQQTLAYNWTPPANLKVWEWPGLGQVGTRFIAAPANTINHTIRAAAEIAKAHPSRTVYVVRIASSGRPIDHWLPGGQDASGTTTWDGYADCKNALEAALAVLGRAKIDLFHWHQGESDTTTGATYIGRWNQMFARFTAESWFPENTPIIINGITSAARKGSDNYRFQNLRLKQIVGAAPWARMFVPTSEIVPDSLWLADGLHMTAAGHDLLGRMEGLCYLYGIGMQAQVFSFDSEKGGVGFGGELPTGLANVEVNYGDQKNAETSIATINTGGGANDAAASKVVGKNGIFSSVAAAVGAFSTSVFHKWTGSGGQYFGVSSTGSFRFYLGNTEALGIYTDFSLRWKGSVRINGDDGAFVPPVLTVAEVLGKGRSVKRLVLVTDSKGLTRPAYADGTDWRWVSDDSIIT